MTFHPLPGHLPQTDILIAHGNPGAREEIRRTLGPQGCDLETVSDGEECLRRLRTTRPDLLVLDPDLPGPSGFEVLQEIRRDPRLTDLLVLFLTRRDDPALLVRSFESGADEFVTSPFDPRELLARVRSMLRIASYQRSDWEQARSIEQDLRLARGLQQNLLPQPLPERPGLGLASIYRPSHSLGGDFFDVLELSETATGIFLADVVGHGMAAALLTTALKTQLVNLPYRSSTVPPGEVLTVMNRTLARMLEDTALYITAVYLRYDAAEGELSWANAGHPRPIGLGSRGEVIELEGAGIPLGILDSARYQTLRLPAGTAWERLFLYTDGLMEQPGEGEGGPEPERFGRERLVQALGSSRQRPLGESLDHLLQTFDRWRGGGEQTDDVNVVGLERRP